MATKPREPIVRAFTLIELLVVVAIIALLVSILLPSLATAREQAKAAVCLSRLKNLITAEQLYQNEFQGYIPGSPLTTGYGLAVYDPKLGPKAGVWQPGMPINTFDYTVPLLRQMGQVFSTANKKRESYFFTTTIGPMQCPSNNQIAPNMNRSSDRQWDIQAISYLTMNTLMRGGKAAYDYWNGRPSPALMSGVGAKDMAMPGGGDIVRVPDGYFPKIDRIGRASIKVYLADGLRYAVNDFYLDYNPNQSDFGGFHSAEPPCDYRNGSKVNQDYTTGKKFAYRHGRGTVINAAMLDGHAEPLKAFWDLNDKTHATGPAVHPKYYYPSGSTVMNSSYLWIKGPPTPGGIANGTKLP
ncbi:MAG: type II secretion system protein [Phycisphaerae bacterium]